MIGTYILMLENSDYKKDIKNIVKLAKNDTLVSDEDFKYFIEIRVKDKLEQQFDIEIDEDLDDVFEYIVKERY